MTRDPVCGMFVEPEKAAANAEYRGETYYFCSKGCAQKFCADPERFLQKALEQTTAGAKPAGGASVWQASAGPILSSLPLAQDPVCGMSVDPAKAAGAVERGGEKYYFCSAGCAQRFVTEPEPYLAAPGPAGKKQRAAREIHQPPGPSKET